LDTAQKPRLFNKTSSDGLGQLDESTKKAIEAWSPAIKTKIDNLLKGTEDNEIQRLIQNIVLRRSPDKAQTEITQLVEELTKRQQLISDKITIGSKPLREGGQNAVFEVQENPNLLIKKPIDGQSDFNSEYRALLRLESMEIETALVKKA
jgi:hypothetical protein